MLLPHATHEAIISSEEMTDHIVHVFEGALVAVAGLGVMIYSSKKEKRFIQ